MSNWAHGMLGVEGRAQQGRGARLDEQLGSWNERRGSITS